MPLLCFWNTHYRLHTRYLGKCFTVLEPDPSFIMLTRLPQPSTVHLACTNPILVYLPPSHRSPLHRTPGIRSQTHSDILLPSWANMLSTPTRSQLPALHIITALISPSFPLLPIPSYHNTFRMNSGSKGASSLQTSRMDARVRSDASFTFICEARAEHSKVKRAI